MFEKGPNSQRLTEMDIHEGHLLNTHCTKQLPTVFSGS